MLYHKAYSDAAGLATIDLPVYLTVTALFMRMQLERLTHIVVLASQRGV